MNALEALSLLDTKLDEYRIRSYAELRERIGHDECLEVKGASGAEYQIEIQVSWDHGPEGDIRVSGGIDDGGLRVLVPICRDFLKSPDDRPC